MYVNETSINIMNLAVPLWSLAFMFDQCPVTVSPFIYFCFLPWLQTKGRRPAPGLHSLWGLLGGGVFSANRDTYRWSYLCLNPCSVPVNPPQLGKP